MVQKTFTDLTDMYIYVESRSGAWTCRRIRASDLHCKILHWGERWQPRQVCGTVVEFSPWDDIYSASWPRNWTILIGCGHLCQCSLALSIWPMVP